MDVKRFLDAVDADFFTGVPDSQLKPLCDCLRERYGTDEQHHIVAANEGNAAALAAGYYLSTGRVPVVYLQNSGLGNIVNPVASLLNEKVYGIPCLFIVGWRGEPGVHDEPQHAFQGEITLTLLNELDIEACVIDRETTEEQVQAQMDAYRVLFAQGKQAAFVVRKGALVYEGTTAYANTYPLSREEAIGCIVDAAETAEESFAATQPGVPNTAQADCIVCTTGKASRELYEVREGRGQSHGCDFLTVGSMGHSSSIALGIALQKNDRRVWCIDGDGAALMHLGAMAVMGASQPKNLIHIVLNNEAHESVGGMPTAMAAKRMDLPGMARACGYLSAVSVDTAQGLKEALAAAKAGRRLAFIEVKCALGARADLGRPKEPPAQNRAALMAHLKNKTPR